MNIKNIQILDEAGADLEAGRSFYNRQQQGIGEYFWDSLISDIESLVIYAGIHSRQYGYFRMTAKRFPYSIYYELENGIVYIVAVLPMKRKPGWVEKRMGVSE